MKNKKVHFAIDKKVKYEIDEDSILAQFPNVKLHEITKNRICLSISQLKNIFDIFNADFNKRFISLWQQQLMSNADYSMPLDESNESFSFKLSNKIEEKVKKYEFENMKLKLKELENRILTLEKKQENQENESSKNF